MAKLLLRQAVRMALTVLLGAFFVIWLPWMMNSGSLFLMGVGLAIAVTLASTMVNVFLRKFSNHE